MKPTINFESQEQMERCLDEWMVRLFLQNWCIKVEFVHESEMKEPGRAGESEVHWVNMDGIIRILYPQDVPELIHVQFQEEVLIHELLHFKYMGFSQNGAGTIDGVYYDVMQHQLLEQMAKSLFMAKYKIQPYWFGRTKKEVLNMLEVMDE